MFILFQVTFSNKCKCVLKLFHFVSSKRDVSNVGESQSTRNEIFPRQGKLENKIGGNQ